MDQRQIALEPARIEVVVQPHHQKRGVDIAHDRVPASVAITAGDVRQRRHAFVHPGFAAA